MQSAAQELFEIEVVGRDVNLIGAANSASAGLVSHRELGLRPLLRTGEILEFVPGMVATQHSGNGKANQYFLRGFNLDHGTDFSTTIDFMPINMRSHGHGQGYTDINFIIPELVEEIEYRKGTYFADSGDFSSAGSAHIKTARHVDETQLALGYGADAYKRLLLAGATESQGGNLIYGLELQRYDGPWQDIREDVKKTNLWLKQRWEQEDSVAEVSVMGYDNSWNSADQIPARAVTSGLVSRFGSIDPTLGGESSRYSIAANYQQQLENASWHAAVYGIDYDMNLYSNFSYYIDPDGDQFQQLDNRRIYGGSLQWTRNSLLGTLPVANTVGAQFRLDDIDEVGLRRSFQRQVQGDIRVDTVTQWNAGLYWENELQLQRGLRSVVGLRYDRHDFDVTALSAADASTLAPNSGREADAIVTAAVSLIYTYNDSTEFYASLGSGYHSNDARGTTISFDPVTAEPVLAVDPLVATMGSEIGVRTFLSDRINASIALWQLDIDSELVFVGDAGNTEDSGRGSTRKGIELSAYYQFAEHWQLDLEYAFTDAAFRRRIDGDNSIPGALRDVFSGGISFNLEGRLHATARVRHFGKFPLDEGQQASGSTLFNLRFGYAITDRFSVTADLLNALDSRDHDIEYFYESRLRSEMAPVADHHYHVFEPRALRVYLSYRF